MNRIAWKLPSILLLLLLVFLPSGSRSLGGGVVGGWMAAAALTLMMRTYGPTRVRTIIRFDPLMFAAFGLFFVLIWGFTSMVAGKPFLTPLHITYTLPGNWSFQIGTPMLIDIGIFLLLTGVISHIVLLFAEQHDLAQPNQLQEQSQSQPSQPSQPSPISPASPIASPAIPDAGPDEDEADIPPSLS